MKPYITSEYKPLKKILIHTPGAEHEQLIPWEGDHPLMGPYPRSHVELQHNHGDLKRFLTQEIGAENVLELGTLLQEIFEQSDLPQRKKILQEILEGNAQLYEAHLKSRGLLLENRESHRIVNDLIQGYPRKLVLHEGKIPPLIIPPKRELMWMRDASAATPAGIVINAMASFRRNLEPALVRAVFQHHPMFDPDSIFLDLLGHRRALRDDPSAVGLSASYLMEGGNILVLSEDTLAIGVGKADFFYANRTTREGFELLVEKILEADTAKKIQRVYLVNVPDLRGFIHLDTVFNMFGPKAGIAMPYIFGYPKPANSSAVDILKEFVRWLRSQMDDWPVDLSRIPTEEDFDHAGKVEVYDRDYIQQKGKVVRLPQKAPFFIDQLVADGLINLDNIVWLGGDPDQYVNPFDHLKVALFEQHNMAGNIFTTAPYRAVAYHRNPRTISSLRAKMEKLFPGAHLEEMSSNEIRTDNGGPHCLTLPLLRDD